MTICADNGRVTESGSQHILRHIKKSETPLLQVKDYVVNVLKQYKQLDQVGYSLGVLDKSSSFSDHVSWCALVAKLDKQKQQLGSGAESQLVESVEYLEKVSSAINKNVVTEIQRLRDKWMWRVLIFDVVAAFVVAAVTMLIMLWAGITPEMAVIEQEVLSRPVFYVLAAVAFLGFITLFHFLVRLWVRRAIVEKSQDFVMPGISMARALLKNTRMRHSIFRPDPVGWNLLQRIKLKRIVKHVEELRKQLSSVLSQQENSTV